MERDQRPAQPPRPPKKPAQRPAPPPRQSPAVRVDLARAAAAGRPWWADLPAVAFRCAVLVLLPFRMLAMALEAAVSAAFVAVFAGVALWWYGWISDETVAEAMAEAGERVLSILSASGVI